MKIEAIFCIRAVIIISLLLIPLLVAALDTYSTPAGTPANHDFRVRVRQNNDAWQELFVYNVKVNLNNPSDASMVHFSFNETVDMEVTYTAGTINTFEMRPASIVTNPVRKGNTITFRLTQDVSFPRKFVIIINNDLDHCLHVLGNPLEDHPPLPTDANVWVVEPGKTLIPLPAGKNIYYFAPGLHTGEYLGAWAEIDLGRSYTIGKIELVQQDYAHKFKVFTREGLTDNYTLAYDGTGNVTTGTISVTPAPITGRYVKVQFYENTSKENLTACRINEVRIYEVGGTENLALNHFRVGSHTEMKNIVDGDDKTAFINNKASGRLWLYANGQQVYIPGSAIVRGGIWGPGLTDITIRGRGILDGSQLLHSFNNDEVNRVMPYINFSRGARITYEGFIMLDNPSWGMSISGSADSKITNTSSIGYSFNTDGIWIGNANRSVVSGCFLRCSDDIFVCNAGDNILVQNCVVWGDKAHIFFMGLGGTLQNSVFRNIDVLGHYEEYPVYQGVFAIPSANNNTTQDLLFENIRIAPFRDPKHAVIWYIHMNNPTPWASRPGNSVRNITYKNISYAGNGEQESLIQGADAEKCVDGIHIINYSRNGTLVTDAASSNIKIGDFVKNVDFKVEKEQK